MKRTSLFGTFTVLALPLFLFGFGPSGHSPVSASGFPGLHPDSNFGKLPLAFEPNQGQTDPQVKFLARGGGYILFVTAQGAVLSLKNPKTPSQPLSKKSSRSKGS